MVYKDSSHHSLSGDMSHFALRYTVPEILGLLHFYPNHPWGTPGFPSLSTPYIDPSILLLPKAYPKATPNPASVSP